MNRERFNELVVRGTSLPADRIKTYIGSDDFQISTIRFGLVHAPLLSCVATGVVLEWLGEILSNIEEIPITLYILEREAFNSRHVEIFDAMQHGAGDVLWVKGGVVVAKKSALMESAPDCIAFTKRIFVAE